MNTGIYTVIGNDVEGEGMKNALHAKGVNVDLVQHDSQQGTNSSTILSAGGDRVIFTYHYRRDYQLPDLPETKFVYLTSIGEDDQPLFKQVLEQQQVKDFKLIFAPGSMQLQEEYSEIELVMQSTDIIIVNKEEAQMLTKSDSSDDDKLLHALQGLGPKEVVITKSMQGSVGLSGEQLEHVGALQVETADTTGAGDTYAATFVAAKLLGKDLRTAMEWGSINAGNVVCQVGCEMGMLERAQVEAQHEISKAKLVFS
jgi:sugar/nucleoside kinase (ribokinase family)